MRFFAVDVREPLAIYAMEMAPAERYITRRQEDSMAVPGSCFSIVVTAVFVGPTRVRKCETGHEQECE